MTNNDIVQKLWNLCDVLRDDGINYSEYVTELVLLLFIKMVHENTEARILQKHPLPEGCRWTDLNNKDGLVLLNDYKKILLTLSTGKDSEGNIINDDPLIRAIYSDAQTRLREPRHLKQLIEALDKIDWFSAQKDGLGDLYEGLLEKNASETKSGAGQYFTPRPLINSMVRCLKPKPGETIQDPAAGTAGFLIAADSYIKSQTDELYDLTDKQQKFQKSKAFIGVELVPSTRRLALMNCLLHGMEGDAEGVVHLGNTLGLAGASLPKADIILTNPPFGTAKGGEASITRDDLTYKTSNKQLAFLQHIYRSLKPGGRAAVLLPDNVLFEAGVGTDIRRDLMNKCNLHTILRLPTGIFYAQGVKTNVLFFTKGTKEDPMQVENCTKKVWIYDLRTNMSNFGKRTPFTEEHLKPFEIVFGDKPDGTSPRYEEDWSFGAEEIEVKDTEKRAQIEDKLQNSRWRCFSREWIADNKGDSLDISWLKDNNSMDAENLPPPSELAELAFTELEEAISDLKKLMFALDDNYVSDSFEEKIRTV
ncbi:class I SAM-dependent DNA methyltransferase [Legionella pneumophila]|uniref:class I SAM-dependent DNA methyltransferase n=1 Tax=Legionella pneumophila TaxID=446 RepID=UPI001A33915F|nr:N-6 DNA methylase [Legionella pneumophila]HAT5923235.1 N-6 DNA methylase [Legionella pneumophila]HAT5960751.1 N-6 DNA methylase [Legionella pneumophila]HAT6325228.1 N-6 DNA methylase [Legionella pneumophila]HAT6338257.1 N-6 DNA methylase [Legionella pneumophila]